MSSKKRSKTPKPKKSSNKTQPISSGLTQIVKNLHERLCKLEPIVVDQKDCKEPAKLPGTALRLMRGRGKTGSFHSGAQNIKVTFTNQANHSGPSAANTANAYVVTLTPGTSPEFASFAGIFDDWRTTHVEAFTSVGFTVTASGINSTVQNPVCHAGFFYDPVDNTALVGVSDAMDYNHSISPVKMGYDGVNSPVGETKSGLWSIKVKIPAPVVDPGILSDLLDSNWVSTKDTAVIVGYWKGYIEAAGALTSSTAATFFRFTCEFRSRR
jgi:hypothetical protein